MKYAGWILSVVLLAAVLILWKCPDETFTSRVDELEKQLAESEARFKTHDDSTKEANAARELIIVNLTAENEMLSGELRVVGSQVTELTKRVRHAKVIRDTVEYFISCDSLVIAAEAQSLLIQQFTATTDSLVSTYKAQDAAKDSMIISRDKLYSDLRGTFNIIADENRNIIKLYEKEKKKHKLSKKLNIALGAAVVVLGGILIVN